MGSTGSMTKSRPSIMMYMAAVLRGALSVTVESVLILFTYCLVNNTKAGYRKPSSMTSRKQCAWSAHRVIISD